MLRRFAPRDAYFRLEQSFQELQREQDQLERRVRRLEKTTPTKKSTTTSEEKLGNSTLVEVKSAVQVATTPFEAIKTALLMTFGKDYILDHSVTGKRANKTAATVKPVYDQAAFARLVKFGNPNFKR